MDLLEVEIDQYRLAAFDGRVLEIFGGSVRRFHVKLLTVRLSGPDKQGTHALTLTQDQNDNTLTLDQAAFDRVQPLLAALKSAGVRVDD